MIKGFKKKGMKAGAVFLISLLLMGSIFVAGASQDGYPVEDYYVKEDVALKHAVLYLEEFVADGTSGLEDWDGATVQKDPVTVYDIHGKKLFYEFAVTKEGKAIGEMEMAASKVLGSSLRRVILNPPLDRENAAQKAAEIAEQEYPNCRILSTKPVCYSYPKEGVMVTLLKPGAKEEGTVIVDTCVSSIVPLKEPTKEGELGAWSIYDKIPVEERAERIENWNSGKSKGNSDDKGEKTLSVRLYRQLTSYTCAPTTGKMIAKYYGYSHSTNYIINYMGTTSSGTTQSGQLDYYQNGISKTNSEIENNPTWDLAKSEINANRPVKSGVQGHARCCRGWKDTGGNFLYINDPAPMFVGSRYWEDWDDIYHTNYIIVK